MAEWNLLSRPIILVGLILAMALPLGCSKIPLNSFPTESIVDREKELDWKLDLDQAIEYSRKDSASPDQSASNFISSVPSDSEKPDEARIVAIADESSFIKSEPIKLTAQPKSQDLPAEISPENVFASPEKPTLKIKEESAPLKLAVVSPMDPPTTNPSSQKEQKNAWQTPPPGIISQPLQPLVPMSESTNQETEKLARNELRPSINPNMAPPLKKQLLEPIHKLEVSEPITIVSSESTVTEAKETTPTCEPGSCPDDCECQTVQPDRVVIVATISPDEVPPFAAHPEEILPVIPTWGQTEKAIEVVSTNEVTFDSSANSFTGPLNQTFSETLENVEKSWKNKFEDVGDLASCQKCDSECDEVCQSSSTPAAVPEVSNTDFVENFSPVDEPTISQADEVASSNDFATPDSAATSFVVEEMETPETILLDLAKTSEPEKLISTPDPEFDEPIVEIQVVKEVVKEVIDNTVPLDVQLHDSIQQLEKDISRESNGDRKNGLEVKHRLLAVLQRQLLGMEQQMPSWNDQERSFWQHQLDALNLMLNSGDDNNTDFAKHQVTVETLDHLRKAVERLESIASLRLTNGAFCREVIGFGQFRTLNESTLAADQKLLVYCEVENFSSKQATTMRGTRYETLLRGSFAIFSEQGDVVQQMEYPIVQDNVRNRRRDFYMYFPVQLENLAPGKYRFDLLVEDINGNKSASLPSIDFTVQ